MALGPEEPARRSRGRVIPIPVQARDSQGRRAGLVTRLVAGSLDGVVVGVLLGVGYAGAAFVVFLINPRGFSFPRPGVIFSLTAGLATATVYLTLAQVLAAGRTYGALVMGLRVVRRGGRRLRFLHAAARAVLVVLVPIGFLWVPIGRGNRSVQDVLLDTEVVYDWGPREPEGPG